MTFDNRPPGLDGPAAQGSLASEFRQQQDIANTLQSALLPDALPEIPGLELAAVYWASGRANEVGGDFYDVFSPEADRWMLVVGDVCGSGPGAASVTSLARHSIRMSGWHGDTPASVLAWLNHALEAEDEPSTCTAAIVAVRPMGDGDFALRCALGGHPRPLLCRASGEIESFGNYGTLLGAVTEVHVEPADATLRRGDALVLYTDGITDAPPPDDLDEAELSGIVASCWADRPDSQVFTDRIIDTVFRDRPVEVPEDDVVILVVEAT